MSSILLWSFSLATAAILLCPAREACAGPQLHILAFGDSLTAGYNLPSSKSFAAQLEQRLLEQGRAVRITNAGLPETPQAAERTVWPGPCKTNPIWSSWSSEPMTACAVWTRCACARISKP